MQVCAPRPNSLIIRFHFKQNKVAFACQECGAESAKWLGRCPDCGAWNSYVEEAKIPASARAVAGGQSAGGRWRAGAGTPERLVDVSLQDSLRIPSGMVELDKRTGYYRLTTAIYNHPTEEDARR